MSFKAVTWAFDQVIGLSQGEKLVLLALAEFANDDNQTWRSREAIAARALCSLRSVASHLSALESRGLVSRAARYSWCEDSGGECAGRGRHKHRVGTLYTLHLDVTGAGGSTHAKFASVENCPECRGSGHTCKICTCGGDEGSTHAKSRSPHMQPVAGITNRNYPPINPPPSPQPPAGRVGEGREDDSSRSSSVSVEGLPPVVLEKIALSLPDAMCTLSIGGMMQVWRVLEPRLAAGWSPAEIRQQLAMRSLPDPVHDMAALVCHRLSELIDAPVRRADIARMQRERVVNAAPSGGPESDPQADAVFRRLRREHPDWSHAQIAREIISSGALAGGGRR